MTRPKERATNDLEPVDTVETPRSVGQAMWRGFKLRCPHCGEGRLFAGFLRSVDRCDRCGEAFHHHRADDLPPYLTIFIVGHVVVAAFMAVQHVGELPLWGHITLWCGVTVALSLALLKPLKGATIGLQWAMRMHGFSGRTEEVDH